MMPGLHPGLLLANKKIQLVGYAPGQYLYIGTAGGAGTKTLGMSIEVVNGVGPYTYSWDLNAGPFGFDPSSGGGTAAGPYVGFSTSGFYDGGEWAFTEVGSASLTVTAANGAQATITLPIYAGQ